MYKEGDLVKLVNQASVLRFGEGPFRVVRVLSHINAVELDEIGSVDVSEIEMDGPVHLAPPEAPRTIGEALTSGPVGTIDERNRRIEVIAGGLLTSSDANVRMSAREILRLVWGDKK